MIQDPYQAHVTGPSTIVNAFIDHVQECLRRTNPCMEIIIGVGATERAAERQQENLPSPAQNIYDQVNLTIIGGADHPHASTTIKSVLAQVAEKHGLHDELKDVEIYFSPIASKRDW